ncbi:MAG: phosphopyruvate hydratase [bacterium]|nr:phosphopyruvate hydratase [bacterium]
MDNKIKRVYAREVLDSRGKPTVEAEVYAGKTFGRAIVPSGASTGTHEAVELRDNDKRFQGNGVLKAVNNINKTLSKKIVGMDCTKQTQIDKKLIDADATKNKSKLGANAILAISMANARAAANTKGIQLFELLGKKKFILPVPFCNVINGGKHAAGDLKMQEFMIAPVKAKSFKDAIRMSAETYHILKKVIAKKYGKTAVNVGDEGGFAPNLKNATEALNILEKAIDIAGYKGKMKIAMDCAASEFYSQGVYNLERKYSASKLVDYYLDLVKSYPIISIEDPFNEDDFKSFADLTKESKIQIVGDDLLVTNTNRIKKAIKAKSCNCLLLKVNQIGTLTEAMDAANMAIKNKWKVMVSHRSGETEDSFIADLSVALACGQIKSGAPCRSERLAKYNQLIRIEESLGKKARYASF